MLRYTGSSYLFPVAPWVVILSNGEPTKEFDNNMSSDRRCLRKIGKLSEDDKKLIEENRKNYNNYDPNRPVIQKESIPQTVLIL